MVLAELLGRLEVREDTGSWKVMKVREYEKHDTGMDCKRHDYPWNERTFMFK